MHVPEVECGFGACAQRAKSEQTTRRWCQASLGFTSYSVGGQNRERHEHRLVFISTAWEWSLSHLGSVHENRTKQNFLRIEMREAGGSRGRAGEWESSDTDNSVLNQICSFHMQIRCLLYSWHLCCFRARSKSIPREHHCSRQRLHFSLSIDCSVILILRASTEWLVYFSVRFPTVEVNFIFLAICC